MLKRLLTLVICVWPVIFAAAQETTSQIVGKITDGKTPLAGATVSALHTPTGVTYQTSTRKDGRYNLPNLRIGGPYVITVTNVGFKKQIQDSIILLLGQDFTADFVMEPESTQLTEITVTSSSRQGKVFNTSHTGSQEIINRSQLERLPTVNRSLQDAMKLTPSANATSVGVAFAGQSNQYNNITVDGANFNNSFGLSGTLGGQTNSQPISLDAIEQVQVNISPYDVRQGGFSGAGVNSVTKSGTNTIHASVYTYIKGPGTQGYKVENNVVPKQSFSYNLRGLTIGGPIIKNKLFFFLSAEQERRTDPGTSFIASDATHAPNGVTVSNANADTLNALAAFLKQQYNYNPGSFQGYSYNTQSDKITFKIDWNINRSNTLTIKYNYLKSSRDVQASNSGSVNSSYGRTPGQYAMPFYGSGYTIFNNFNIVIAELNTRLSNKASNKLQVGYTALRDYRNALTSSPFPLVDILDGAGNPYTSFGFEQFTYGNKLNTDVFQFNDIFTFYKGSHEITVGTQNSFKKYENGFSPSYQGVYRFNSLAQFYAAAADTSAHAARYDLSYTLPPNSTFPLVGPKDQEYGFFIQDKWKVKSNLTLVYGLRVDIPVFQNTFLYNPVVDTLSQFYKGIHVNTGQGPHTNPLFGPRFGFNWDIKGDQQTQVRGGAGLFAGPPPFVWISNQASNSGVALFGSVSNGAGYYFSPDVNPNPHWPNATNQGLSKSYSINVTNPSYKFPQAFKSSLAIDQKLPAGFIVTLEGTYAKDVNASFFQNINLPATGITMTGADNRTRYTSSQIYPVGGAGAASVTNPNIGNAIYMTNVNSGYAYTATIQVQKNFRDVYVNVAYTYSKSEDVMVGGSTAATMWGSKPVVGDPNAPELGFSNAYLPHRIIASAYYKIAYGKNFATTIGAIYEASPSGVGSYVYTGDLNGDGQTSNDLIYIPTQADFDNGKYKLESSGGTDPRTPQDVWNQLNAFINQDKYLSKHRGQYAGRNALIYPWFKRMDLNVTQDFYFNTNHGRDRHTLRLSADIVNLGNLLNKNWGVYKIPSAGTGNGVLNVGIIKFDKMDVDKTTPIYSFPYQVAASQTPYTTSFKDDISILSRWQMQIGIRYMFN
ncbi:MAG: carboxypeptidase regulatory-like domain-containing protein [Chitinophagales bacterium]